MPDSHEDHILQDIRANREHLFEKHGGTIESFMREMRLRDARHGETVDRSRASKRDGDASSASPESAA